DFKVREAASADLLKHGEVARKPLQEAVRRRNHAEISRRAQQVLNLIDEERRLASRMHVVGLYEAGRRPHFPLGATWGQHVDWPQFCEALVEQGKQDARTPGKRVWELVPQEAQAIALDKNQVHQINVFARRQLEGGATERGAITAMNKL